MTTNTIAAAMADFDAIAAAVAAWENNDRAAGPMLVSLNIGHADRAEPAQAPQPPQPRSWIPQPSLPRRAER